MGEISVRLLKKLGDYLLLVLAVGAYGWAMVLPTWLCAGDPLVGSWVLTSGWLGLIAFEPRWFCNALLPLTLLALFAGERLIPWWASMLIALVAATTLFGPYFCAGSAGSLGIGTGPASGQLLWVSSMFLFALWDPRGLQKTRRGAGGALPGGGNSSSVDRRDAKNVERNKQDGERKQREVVNREKAALGTSSRQLLPLGALLPLDQTQLDSLCVGYFKLKGFAATRAALASGDGVVSTLYRAGIDAPVAVVQCKIRGSAVSSEQIHMMGRLVQQQQAVRGVFWSVSGYAEPSAVKLAEQAGIEVLDGVAILERLWTLDKDALMTLWSNVQKA